MSVSYIVLLFTLSTGVYSALYPIKIRCNYDSQYKDSAKVWCKQNTSLCCDGFALNGSCVTINQGKGQLVDLKDEGVFLVELSAFTSAEQGVYWCAVMDGDAIIKLQEFKLFNELNAWDFLRYVFAAIMLLVTVSVTLVANRNAAKKRTADPVNDQVELPAQQNTARSRES